ncbi:MAG: DnaJ domain-containing protein [Alphaproteobacteria bacterium]|nr:MAG: DnaJ domain-containing protein [Alphaproteobacteria bacterium]
MVGKIYATVMMQNPFELLRLPLEFDIPDELLQRNYHKLMKTVHPDLYHTQTEKDFMTAKAMLINQAFQKLRDPIQRASILLETLHIDVDATASQPDLEFLEEIIQLQEIRDSQLIQRTFDKAQTNFARAFLEKNLSLLKKSFSTMKYLSKSVSKPIKTMQNNL